jgi:hypothetical protein
MSKVAKYTAIYLWGGKSPIGSFLEEFPAKAFSREAFKT